MAKSVIGGFQKIPKTKKYFYDDCDQISLKKKDKRSRTRSKTKYEFEESYLEGSSNIFKSENQYD